MNLAVLSGRLTRDPELKFGQSGKAYCKFSIAVDRPFKSDVVDFFNCVAFGKTAEFVGEYIRKGRKISTIGIFIQERWEENGQSRMTYRFQVNNVEFADSKPKEEKEDLKDYVNTNDEFSEDAFPF